MWCVVMWSTEVKYSFDTLQVVNSGLEVAELYVGLSTVHVESRPVPDFVYSLRKTWFEILHQLIIIIIF